MQDLYCQRRNAIYHREIAIPINNELEKHCERRNGICRKEETHHSPKEDVITIKANTRLHCQKGGLPLVKSQKVDKVIIEKTKSSLPKSDKEEFSNFNKV